MEIDQKTETKEKKYMNKKILREMAKALEREKLLTPAECLALEKLLEALK